MRHLSLSGKTLLTVVIALAVLPARADEAGVNSVSFRVEANSPVEQYASFWLLPAQYADGTYTTYTVHVNGQYAGKITTDKANWQVADLDSDSPLVFKKGVNTITVSTPAPEMPEVERVCLSGSLTEQALKPNEYTQYLDDINSGEMVVTQNIGMTADPASSTDDGPETFNNVPLYYSFHKTFEFVEGREIFITSNSDTEHIMDLIYIGKEGNVPDLPGIPAYPVNPTGYTNGGAISNVNPNLFKPQRVNFINATSDEMQGLNWKNNSEKAVNGTAQVSCIRFTVPKDGFYLLRLRSTANGLMGMADINVNATYFYSDCPFSFSSVEYEMDTFETYLTFTECADKRNDDPMLFIHGRSNRGDHIVGFNDDYRNSEIQGHNTSLYDAAIALKYKYSTALISVSSYGSYNPVSSCKIHAGLQWQPVTNDSNPKRSVSGTRLLGDVNEVRIEYSDGGSELTVSSINDILSVGVYSMDGYLLGTNIGSSENQMFINLSEHGLNAGGIYLIRVETEEGIVTKKIIIR